MKETKQMTEEEWAVRVKQIEGAVSKYDQLDLDAKKFLDDNAILFSDYWAQGVVCKHCGKAYFLNMYNCGQLQLGKMYRNFYNHMIKIHGYKDESYFQLMKFHIREMSYKTECIGFTEGDH